MTAKKIGEGAVILLLIGFVLFGISTNFPGVRDSVMEVMSKIKDYVDLAVHPSHL